MTTAWVSFRYGQIPLRACHQKAHHPRVAPSHREVQRQPFGVAGSVAIH
jgi:hypothetical protein